MSATNPLYQSVLQRVSAAAPHWPRPRAKRFALLVTGIVAAGSAVLAKVAAEALAAGFSSAQDAESVERTLRRALSDAKLTAAGCYRPALQQLLDWPQLLGTSRTIEISVDESSCADKTHLLRICLSYWGGSLPLVWRIWPQNVAQSEGHYWQQIDECFAELAGLLPRGLEVIIVADRAYAVPNFIDRCAQHGWHWVIRVTTTGSHRYVDEQGHEHELRAVVRRQLQRAGQRFKRRGRLFKAAQWRTVHLVGIWSHGAKESLVIISDLAADYKLLRHYERRFWIECGFRNDKSRGWHWEQSQVRSAGHQEVLVLALAWASLIAWCVGVAHAQQQLQQEANKRAAGRVSKPRKVRASIFVLGLREVRKWLYGTRRGALPWRLGEIAGPSWQQRWYECQVRWLVLPARAA